MFIACLLVHYLDAEESLKIFFVYFLTIYLVMYLHLLKRRCLFITFVCLRKTVSYLHKKTHYHSNKKRGTARFILYGLPYTIYPKIPC